MNQIGLYYPYIAPPESWAKCSLLLFDKISTITPDWLGDRPPNDLLDWLEEEGLWEPTFAYWLSDAAYRDEIETVLLEFSDSRHLRLPLISGNHTWPGAVLLKLGKLSYFIEEGLAGLGLGHRCHDGIYVHEEVAAIILAITARHTAAADRRRDSRLVTSTDMPLYVSYAFDPVDSTLSGGVGYRRQRRYAADSDLDSGVRRRRQERYQCLELLLDGVLPNPGPLVSIPDVVDFRRRYEDEAILFRRQLEALVQAITTSDDPLEAFRSAREGINLAVRNIQAASRGKFGVARNVAVVAATVAVTNSFSPDLAHWIFDGIGTVAAGSVVRRTVRGTPATNPFTYLVRSEQRFGAAR